jgi:hypothetical protein
MADTLADLDKRLSVHENGCEIRQKAINARLGRLEKILISCAGFILLGQFTIIWFFVTHYMVH